MKNLIVSYDKMPPEVHQALNKEYPHGYDHVTFEFEVPTKKEIYTALRLNLNGINYVIKLATREKNIDNPWDLE
jgi:hypothetical protein